jgi:outer membrane protein OmpA-like peptidoglycan-associated protein
MRSTHKIYAMRFFNLHGVTGHPRFSKASMALRVAAVIFLGLASSGNCSAQPGTTASVNPLALSAVAAESRQADTIRPPHTPANNISAADVTPVSPSSAAPHGGTLAASSHPHSIYFPYRSVQLTPSAVEKIQRQAERLRANPRLTVTLYGFANDLASTSYNIAVAARRVQSVRELLLTLKVLASQIRGISFGHEMSRVGPCLSELCQAGNRRVEFHYGH